MPKIHPTAVVDSAARLADDVEIGPYCVIGPHVTLASGVRLMAHVLIDGRTSLGSGTVVFPYAALGLVPQHLNYKGEPTTLSIGAGAVVREHVTMHVGTAQGGGATVVGDNCFIMVGAHVAHDCHLENNVMLTNSVALGGHVTIGEFAIIGGQCGVQQHVRIGRHAMIGGKTGVDRDIIPYGSAQGNRAKLSGLNLIGLKRRGFSRDDIQKLRSAYGLLFSHEGTMAERLSEVADLYSHHAGVMDIVRFVRADSNRPLCTPASGSNGNGG
ncbi:MAG: acyl-ACP--UDP-N-acetylglucosamine O-acyltransferase [Alphaproteobacteria bacterium]|nr:acyl-ACP--UDP-N-acetylglucosamine O-acyltransferase [Alphaproteobacteria bacterium]